MKMRYRQIIYTLILFGSVIGFFLYIFIEVYDSPISKSPYVIWKDHPESEVIISWETESLQDAIVYYGEYPEYLNYSSNTTDLEYIHHITCSGLKSDTLYYYRVGSFHPNPLNLSIIQQFRTAPLNFTSFDFIATSDTQQMMGNGWIQHLMQKISISDTRFLTIVGDLTEEGHQKIYWDSLFGQISSVTQKIPLVPVIGNHDANLFYTNEFPFWMHEYFPISIDSDQFFYSFNYSSVHFTIADVEWGIARELTNTQLTWLEEDLAHAQDLPFRIVLFHCPILASGYYQANTLLQNQIKPLLKSYNVSLILNGHDHHYERLLDDGLVYVLLGGGGAIQEPIIVQLPESQGIYFGPSYTRFWINSTHITLKTFSLSHEIVDQFVISSIGGG